MIIVTSFVPIPLARKVLKPFGFPPLLLFSFHPFILVVELGISFS